LTAFEGARLGHHRRDFRILGTWHGEASARGVSLPVRVSVLPVVMIDLSQLTNKM
jgi:hypothetical protein